MLKIVAIKE
jgi:hypothetical protein